MIKNSDSNKLGINATKKTSGESFKCCWASLVTMDAAVKARMEKLINGLARVCDTCRAIPFQFHGAGECIEHGSVGVVQAQAKDRAIAPCITH